MKEPFRGLVFVGIECEVATGFVAIALPIGVFFGCGDFADWTAIGFLASEFDCGCAESVVVGGCVGEGSGEGPHLEFEFEGVVLLVCADDSLPASRAIESWRVGGGLVEDGEVGAIFGEFGFTCGSCAVHGCSPCGLFGVVVFVRLGISRSVGFLRTCHFCRGCDLFGSFFSCYFSVMSVLDKHYQGDWCVSSAFEVFEESEGWFAAILTVFLVAVAESELSSCDFVYLVSVAVNEDGTGLLEFLFEVTHCIALLSFGR